MRKETIRSISNYRRGEIIEIYPEGPETVLHNQTQLKKRLGKQLEEYIEKNPPKKLRYKANSFNPNFEIIDLELQYIGHEYFISQVRQDLFYLCGLKGCNFHILERRYMSHDYNEETYLIMLWDYLKK